MFSSRLWQLFLDSFPKILLPGLTATIPLTIISFSLALVIAVVAALVQFANIQGLKQIARFYIWIFRGTPLLVQLMLIYFATPQLTSYTISALEAGVLSFGLNSAAYISEALRGGILAVDKGQWEGAMSLGVPKHRFLLDIILPQLLRMHCLLW